MPGAVGALSDVTLHRDKRDIVQIVVEEGRVLVAERAAVHGSGKIPGSPRSVPDRRPPGGYCSVVYRNAGAIMSANDVRARFSRDLTVPTGQPRTCAISGNEASS